MSDDDNQEEDLREVISTGEGIVRMLIESGITTMFGIPDGHTLALYDAMYENEAIKHILVNDERTAAFAADAYARVTNTVGICDAGAAGSMNFPVALTEAKGFGSPVLALAAVVKTEDLLKNVPHDINVTEALKAVTKWSEKVLGADQVPRFLSFALRTAVNGKPGPVGLILPENVLKAKELWRKRFIPSQGGSCSINGCKVAPTQHEVDHAVEMIRTAEHPVLFCGTQSVSSGAFGEVEKLSRMLEAPVFTTITGKGIMTEGEKRYFGAIGLFGEKPNNRYLRSKADLIIVVGSRLTEDDTANFKFPPTHKDMIQLDIKAEQIGLSYNSWGVIGDCKLALQMIIDRLEECGIYSQTESKQEKPEEGFLEKRKKSLKKLRTKLDRFREADRKKWMNSEPIKPQRVLFALSKHMNESDYLVTDASASSRWINAYYPVKSKGRKIITPRGVGPTGFGLGALLGTCIALKEQNPKNPAKAILITGDGGLMNAGLSDIQTLVELELNTTIVVLNNSALGYVKFGQAILYHQRIIDTNRPTTNFVKIGESLGAQGHLIKNIEELDSIIASAIKDPGVKILDVQIDPNELLPPNFY